MGTARKKQFGVFETGFSLPQAGLQFQEATRFGENIGSFGASFQQPLKRLSLTRAI